MFESGCASEIQQKPLRLSFKSSCAILLEYDLLQRHKNKNTAEVPWSPYYITLTFWVMYIT